jgi:tRNA dimethylallyltransferase
LTGRPLTDHFADTASLLPDYEISAFALQIPVEATADRVARRVDAQFRQGLMDEVRGLLAAGVPETAHPFTGLVYRQALELLKGVRDEPATRELIVRENRRYARRQLIWFRKEPNLHWVYASGERQDTEAQVANALLASER